VHADANGGGKVIDGGGGGQWWPLHACWVRHARPIYAALRNIHLHQSIGTVVNW